MDPPLTTNGRTEDLEHLSFNNIITGVKLVNFVTVVKLDLTKYLGSESVVSLIVFYH